MLVLFFQVRPFTISSSGPVQGAMVGSPQTVQCTVSTDGMDFDSIMITWMGPGRDTITSDSRVTIISTTSSGNTYTSSIQFSYLMEGDEGIYTCNVITSTGINESELVVIETLTGKYNPPSTNSLAVKVCFHEVKATIPKELISGTAKSKC